MNGREQPQLIEFCGRECLYCHGHNTMIEFWRTGPEGICWECSRPFQPTRKETGEVMNRRNLENPRHLGLRDSSVQEMPTQKAMQATNSR